MFHQFISPYSNRRNDEYGGSHENRMRLPLKVMAAIREKVGQDYVVGCRIPHDEIVEGGLSFSDTREVAKDLVKGGADYARVVVGVTPPRGKTDSQRNAFFFRPLDHLHD